MRLDPEGGCRKSRVPQKPSECRRELLDSAGSILKPLIADACTYVDVQ